MATIERRGPHQFRVRIRRNGVTETRTFETRRAAEDWARTLEGKVTGDEFVDQSRAKETTLWALVSLRAWDLLEWRREVLDEDNADDSGQVGPDAEFGVQSCIHRLNLISHLYGQWSLLHQTPLHNPIIRGVRPLVGGGRERRLDLEPDDEGNTEEDRLYAVCDASRSRWLGAAVRIAIETGLRQAELAGMTFDRLHLDGPYRHSSSPRSGRDR